MNHLSARQELFCLKYVELGNATQAMIQAGYAPKYAHQNTTHVLDRLPVQVRIKELRQKIVDDSIMSGMERRQRLSEIARARLTDFMELGQDGSWVNLGPEVKGSGAIQEIHSRTEYDDDGAHPTIHTSVKLHDPMKAIAELNKMDGVYSDNPQVHVEINIGDPKEKLISAISRLAARESKIKAIAEP